MTLVCMELNNEGRGIGCKLLMWEMNCFFSVFQTQIFLLLVRLFGKIYLKITACRQLVILYAAQKAPWKQN